MKNYINKLISSDYFIVTVLLAIVGAYAFITLYKNLSSKGHSAPESMMDAQNGGGDNVQIPAPSSSSGQSGEYASIQESTGASAMPSACPGKSIQDPADLLPKNDNSKWAELNPSGKGDLANINLLKAGYHIGIDTVGQTLRNGNQQLRSEPANPQLNTGPWNQSTIEPDFMRPPLEIASGNK
jgi:hypothetical protein